MNMTLVILGHLAILAMELPYVVRRRLRREYLAAVVITSVSGIIAVLLAAGVPLPSPTDWIEAVFRPLAGHFGFE